MKKIIIGLLVFTFLGNGVGAKALAYSFENEENRSYFFDKKKGKGMEARKPQKSKRWLISTFFKKINKGRNKGVRVFKRLFYKKNKNTPPRKGEGASHFVA
jgi:hypothetical protein